MDMIIIGEPVVAPAPVVTSAQVKAPTVPQHKPQQPAPRPQKREDWKVKWDPNKRDFQVQRAQRPQQQQPQKQHPRPRNERPPKPSAPRPPVNPEELPPIRHITLRRAYGLGFGTGEMLVQFSRKDRHMPMEVIESFMPEGIEHGKCTRPFDMKKVTFERKNLKPHHRLAIVEVTSNSVDGSLYRLNSLSGEPLSEWRDLESGKLKVSLSTTQEAVLAAFTGVFVKLQRQAAKVRQQEEHKQRWWEQQQRERRGPANNDRTRSRRKYERPQHPIAVHVFEELGAEEVKKHFNL